MSIQSPGPVEESQSSPELEIDTVLAEYLRLAERVGEIKGDLLAVFSEFILVLREIEAIKIDPLSLIGYYDGTGAENDSWEVAKQKIATLIVLDRLKQIRADDAWGDFFLSSKNPLHFFGDLGADGIIRSQINALEESGYFDYGQLEVLRKYVDVEDYEA